jgi:PAS domain S-box-containing protein
MEGSPTPPAEESPGGLGRVLIIDDERDSALRLADILEAHGYEPVLAHDAASAEALQAEAQAPVALIDAHLAGRSGLALLTTLRGRYPQLLPVVMTASADVDSAVVAVHSGAYDFLRKPFEARELLAVLERCFAHARLDREKRAAEQALHESEGRYRTLFESAGDGIMILSEGVFVDVNQRAAEMLGWSPAEVLGCTPWGLSPPTQPDGRKSRAAALDYLAGVLEGTQQRFEWRHRRADGSDLDAEVSLTAVELGGSTHVQAIVRDISGRKQTEGQLARLATAVEHADEDIMITDAHGAIEYVNPAFERITGYARGEVLGKTPRVLRSGAHGADFYAGLWRTLSDGRTWLGRFTNRRKDGALILEDASISPILDREGRVLGYVSVKRDVTRQVHLERHLVEARKMDALGTLAGGIAHDFNNILSAILGSVDLGLRAVSPDSKPARHLGNIRLAASRAAELTRQILAFSRRAPQESRPTDLRVVVEETLNLLRASLPTTIEIERRLTAERAVQADATQIHQVLMNLGANAGLAMREGGGVLAVALEDVTVGAALADQRPGLVPGPYVRLTIADTGQGMSPEVLARAFEPFYTTRPHGEGTGMGLAVVHGIVRNHGGTIHVVSSPGAGATFTIHLPALGQAVAAAPPVFERPPRGTERVLLVDDEEFHLDVTQELLVELGYRVTCCADGREALERIAEAPAGFDIVLTDVTMPRLTGDALLRELRRLEVSMPVILCTGFGDQWTLEGARAQGAQGLLLKPVALWDLATAIRQALAETAAPRP